MLLIDAGNTRCKWAHVEQGVWMRHGVADYVQMGNLHGEFAALPTAQKVLISNVAGEAVNKQLRECCAGLADSIQFICSKPEQCGVKNGYQQASQLGSDRWAALIAAWHQVRGACLVVNCGTATTVDTLSASGEFLGGLILPGMALMQASLHQHTAQLAPTTGHWCSLPRNTADAIYSGALQATVGAIRQQAALSGTQKFILSGGAAGNIHAHLGASCELVDNLVLRGLAIIGQE